jgi:hypothetical protein
MVVCNGSWKDSARNITYEGNVVECELASMNGTWIKNRLTFLPQIHYSNSDGKFKWGNCQNDVEFGNNSYEHISRRYKKITVEQCLEKINTDYDTWFEIEKEYVQLTNTNACISISLFEKNVDNRCDNEFPVHHDNWISKYYNSLLTNLNNFTRTDMCVNLYLANDLANYIPELLKHTFLNIYLMKSSSIGAMPGMLWRFINLTNKSYNTVYVVDIDEPWSWVNDWEGKGLEQKISTLRANDVIICENPYSPAINFTSIIGSHIRAKPAKFDFNIVDVIKGFIALCKDREKSNNPYCFHDNDPITYWNYPIGNHRFGWGRLVLTYGFDEFFLKHVIYHNAYPDISYV